MPWVMMLGKVKHIFPNGGFSMFFIVIYHGTIGKKQPKTNPRCT